MSKNLRKLGRSLGLVIAFLVAFEGFVFLRWIFFSGPEPSLHDLQTGLGILIVIWAISKLAGWLERRDARDKEIAARVRAMDARIEALYKWGGVCFSGDDEKDNDDWEWELDDATKAEIAECREGMKRGDTTSHHNLGVIFWNRAMTYYNAQTKDGYREALHWLRKAASVGYDCENTLGDAYIKLQDYDEAMYWYRRSLKRGGSLAWIAESNIADMYAEGQGVSVNHAEAAWWWNKAAQHGSDWSHYKLGKLYAEGADGVEKDNRKAYFHLYIASATTGQYSPQKSAVELRGQIEKELGDYFTSQEKKRAEEWLANRKEIARQNTRSKVRPLPLPD
jgi:tetratricopeptide (TPR) repeat protein